MLFYAVFALLKWPTWFAECVCVRTVLDYHSTSSTNGRERSVSIAK